MSVKHHIKSIAIGAALFTFGGIGCGGDESGPLGSVDSLIILQRAKRNDGGDVFQYTSYIPGARLVQLSPPTADGTLTTICCDQDPEFSKADISGYDISFDAKTIVFSAKLNDNESYGLFLLQLADKTITQIPTDPGHDFVSPIFLPGDRILFMTNAVVEAGAKQHQDEYERGETTQLGRINIDGTNVELGPRNLSHRSFPSLTSDGRVIMTQWDHLGGENSGHLMFVNVDMQNLREAYGKEGSGLSNSVIKPVEIAPGRYLAIATSRSRTITAGALIDVRLGTIETRDGIVSAPNNQSEANATVRELTPDVPTGEELAADTVGRYYDGYPLNAKDKPDLLVSWANGPVEAGALERAGLSADFGIYLYDSANQQRRPILNDPEMWDIFARPLQTRSAPNVVASAQDPKLGNQMLIGSLNVYDSTLHPPVAPGEIYGVRVMEGFSSEEGAPRMFGTTMFEGHANLGIAEIAADNSWSALVPANVPLHLQTVDKFGMSLFNEGFWFSGRAGEARVCGGCHEDRARTTNVSPGLLDTFALGATPMFGNTPRAARANTNPTNKNEIVGVPWNTVVQQVFDDNCTGCHNGVAGPANPSYTITDGATGQLVATWVFDLRGGPVPAALSVASGGATYSASYFSMAGPDMEAIEEGNLILGPGFKVYMNPMEARDSEVIKKLNPFQIFPTEDTTKRAFATQSHLQAQGRPELNAQEFYTLILAADMGVLYYSRENLPARLTY
jgi:hypothetical protein